MNKINRNETGLHIFLDHLDTVVLRFSISSLFEQFSFSTSVFEHSSWEPKRAEWSRNALRARSRGNDKSRMEPKCNRRTDSLLKRTDFLLKRRGRLLPSKIHLQKRDREGKKTLKESYPVSFRSLMLFRYKFS